MSSTQSTASVTTCTRPSTASISNATSHPSKHPNNSSTQDSQSYPEQHHAGAVGYGPNYRQGATLSDKITGLKEELKGKVTKNSELLERGRERKTGELKKKEHEQDMNNMDPFQTADDDDEKDENDEKAGNTDPSVARTKSNPTKSSSPDAQPNTSSAFPTSSTSSPPQPAQSFQTQSFASNAKRDAQGQHLQREGAPPSASGMAQPRDIKHIDEHDGDERTVEPRQFASDVTQL
ncbi:hypothetical protein J3R30DRAFT_3707147 [Lentinula aciculospora]|uniref:Uncharacterized protein n=1 Tax=Lentinula aciculospora TaxID=153920 RepID=A0A9W9DK55_9AGAR|nr:hypothetical protein J3R30DRAFT_3707147 [Lentinula aciculospora]